MKIISILIIQLFCFILSSFAQTKTLIGKIVDDFTFQPVGFVDIAFSDTGHLLTTDFEKGEFKIQVPDSTKSLLIRTVGYQEKIIYLNDTCDQLDIILERQSTDCFASLEENDRQRLRKFKKISTLHKEAYTKGIFKTERPCYKQKFMAWTKWKRFQKII